MRFGRLSLLQYLLSANSVCISYFYFVYCIISVCCLFVLFTVYVLLYITVLLPVGVIIRMIIAEVRYSQSIISEG